MSKLFNPACQIQIKFKDDFKYSCLYSCQFVLDCALGQEQMETDLAECLKAGKRQKECNALKKGQARSR